MHTSVSISELKRITKNFESEKSFIRIWKEYTRYSELLLTATAESINTTILRNPEEHIILIHNKLYFHFTCIDETPEKFFSLIGGKDYASVRNIYPSWLVLLKTVLQYSPRAFVSRTDICSLRRYKIDLIIFAKFGEQFYFFNQNLCSKSQPRGLFSLTNNDDINAFLHTPIDNPLTQTMLNKVAKAIKDAFVHNRNLWIRSGRPKKHNIYYQDSVTNGIYSCSVDKSTYQIQRELSTPASTGIVTSDISELIDQSNLPFLYQHLQRNLEKVSIVPILYKLDNFNLTLNYTKNFLTTICGDQNNLWDKFAVLSACILSSPTLKRTPTVILAPRYVWQQITDFVRLICAGKLSTHSLEILTKKKLLPQLINEQLMNYSANLSLDCRIPSSSRCQKILTKLFRQHALETVDPLQGTIHYRSKLHFIYITDSHKKVVDMKNFFNANVINCLRTAPSAPIQQSHPCLWTPHDAIWLQTHYALHGLRCAAGYKIKKNNHSATSPQECDSIMDSFIKEYCTFDSGSWSSNEAIYQCYLDFLMTISVSQDLGSKAFIKQFASLTHCERNRRHLDNRYLRGLAGISVASPRCADAKKSNLSIDGNITITDYIATLTKETSHNEK